jgi:hypothetical protein
VLLACWAGCCAGAADGQHNKSAII